MGLGLALALGLGAVGVMPRARPTASAVRVLVDREEVFPAVLELIRSAEHEVLLSMYLLGGERARGGSPAGIGRAIVDALLERQRAGVRVRVISSRFVAVEEPRRPRAPDDVWFHPVFDDAVAEGLPILRPSLPKGGIDHTKYLIVDGRDAIFGGMNLADAVASNHDVMVWVSGPAAAELQAIFAASWEDARAAAGDAAPAAVADDPPILRVREEELEGAIQRRAQAGWSRCALDLRRTAPGVREIHPALLEDLADVSAGDSIRLSVLLLGEPGLTAALVAAHQRGAWVRVILDPNEAFYGVDCQGSLNAEAMVTLADAGIEVRHYAVVPGQEMHMKVYIRERAGGDRLFTVGSANWTRSDMFRNREVTGLFSACEGPAQALVELFEADWAERTRPTTAALLERYRDPEERRRLAKTCAERLGGEAWVRGRR